MLENGSSCSNESKATLAESYLEYPSKSVVLCTCHADILIGASETNPSPLWLIKEAKVCGLKKSEAERYL